ncbi:MAG: hypothetical protein GX610_04600 [Rhodococcus sp.]|nr:hypothetical protein [Rhodococcus sp. (in: high G+C Gram-positive bacteria)]
MTRRKPRSGFPAKVDLLERLVDPRLEGAKCTGRAPIHDHEIDGETPAERGKRLAYARRLCEQCPVRSMCRTAAAEQTTPAGMWGGRLRNREAA